MYFQDDYDCMDPQRQESSSSRWCMYLDAEEVDGMNTNTGDDMYTTDWREYRASNKAARLTTHLGVGVNLHQ